MGIPDEKFSKPINVFIKLGDEGPYYLLRNFPPEKLSKMSDNIDLSFLNAIDGLESIYNKQSAVVSRLLHEKDLLNKSINQLTKANKTKSNVILSLHEENRKLRTKCRQATEMYNELMEKNIKLQKIIDALTEE